MMATTSSYGRFLGYGKRLHLYNLPMSQLIFRIMNNNGRLLRIHKALEGLSIVWRDRRGRSCAAFERWGQNGMTYCVIYRCMGPYDRWENGDLTYGWAAWKRSMPDIKFARAASFRRGPVEIDGDASSGYIWEIQGAMMVIYDVNGKQVAMCASESELATRLATHMMGA
jgi:hypothetical protein